MNGTSTRPLVAENGAIPASKRRKTRPNGTDVDDENALPDEVSGQISGRTPTPPARRRRFKNAKSIRLELSETVHGLKDGTLDIQKGRAITYALSVLLSAIQGSELEREVEELKEIVLEGRIQ